MEDVVNNSERLSFYTRTQKNKDHNSSKVNQRFHNTFFRLKTTDRNI